MGQVPPQLQKYVFKAGNTANLKGRPKGKSLKEFAREYFSRMPNKEKLKFLNGLDPDIIWRMGEGNPATKIDAEIDIKVEKLEEIQKATQIILNEPNPKISSEPL